MTPAASRLSVTDRAFCARYVSTRLGARLARLQALLALHEWDIPCDTELSDRAALIVAELAANAVTHGRLPGRDFELRLTLTATTLRIDVSDARAELRPPSPSPTPHPLADSGRGLLLVATLADRWAVLDRTPIGKTLRAELDVR
jgi:anti-sigma regulatory factor (Ser/Thr protein kinase)